MKNQKRQSGKTSKLKQRILEDMMKCNYNKYVIITSNRDMMLEYQKWSDEFTLVSKNNIIIVYDPLELEFLFRGISNNCVGVYVDEPFIISREKQSQFLNEFNHINSRNSVNVYGIGTRVQQPEQTFEDYLKD